MKVVDTYAVQIFVGLRVGYSERLHTLQEAEAICQEYVDLKSLCVTVTPTKYIYKNGSEPGIIVGLIRYPRFPREVHSINDMAMALAELLRQRLEQQRVTVMFPDRTVLLGDE